VQKRAVAPRPARQSPLAAGGPTRYIARSGDWATPACAARGTDTDLIH